MKLNEREFMFLTILLQLVFITFLVIMNPVFRLLLVTWFIMTSYQLWQYYIQLKWIYRDRELPKTTKGV